MLDRPPNKKKEICPVCRNKITNKAIVLKCKHIVCNNPKCSKGCKCAICKTEIESKTMLNYIFNKSCMNCGKDYGIKRKYEFGCHTICKSCIRKGCDKLTCPVCGRYTTNKIIMHEFTKHKYKKFKTIHMICHGWPSRYRYFIIGITSKCGTGHLFNFISNKPDCECKYQYKNDLLLDGIYIYHIANSQYYKCNRWNITTNQG